RSIYVWIIARIILTSGVIVFDDNDDEVGVTVLVLGGDDRLASDGAEGSLTPFQDATSRASAETAN
ncbi:hypothetical protein FRC04_006276, partial [Tulasnella sp. 424]